MDHTFWHKQSSAKPLFPDIVWSRPENKRHAGKLLIVGGNAHGFAAPAEAYQIAEKAGAGSIRVVLPDSLQKTVGTFLDNAFFLPSTRSGSLAKSALAELMEHSAWSDGVLLAGELGRNSETAVLLETFVKKHTSTLVVTKDAIDYFYADPASLCDRENTALVLSLSQLQQLTKRLPPHHPIKFSMGMMQLVEWLHHFSLLHPCSIVVQHLNTIFVATNGTVSSTHEDNEVWRLDTAAKMAVWYIQQPSKPFESLTTALVM